MQLELIVCRHLITSIGVTFGLISVETEKVIPVHSRLPNEKKGITIITNRIILKVHVDYVTRGLCDSYYSITYRPIHIVKSKRFPPIVAISQAW